jgi:hypothetical protein
MKKLFLALLLCSSLLISTGCITTEKRVEIECKPTEVWENHYFTVEEFKTKTETIELKPGQSIWVLSNDTLKRVLKDASK